MRALALASLLLTLCACALAPQAGDNAARSANKAQGPVILIGIDGLRWDAIDRAEAPNLNRLADQGVRARGLIPIMPSVTFSNFYAIATGLYADRHGMPSNAPYDRSADRTLTHTQMGDSFWWGGEPIWATAEKQGVTTATLFWVGSEAEVAGVRPTYWKRYDWRFKNADRVQQVLDWLALPEADKPGFITLYFSSVDYISHARGVETQAEREAIAKVDSHIGDLMDGLNALGLQGLANIVIVSDHGMTNTSPTDRVVYLDDYIDFSQVYIPELEGPRPGHQPFAHIFVEDGASVDDLYDQLAGAHPNFTVYRRETLPESYAMAHPDRTGDLFVLPDLGWLVFGRSVKSAYPTPPLGMHGYDHSHTDMWGTFIANGPAFPSGRKTDAFENIEIYGLLAHLLDITPSDYDGDFARIRPILKP